jgi:peptide/nickel transport system ATP-binding protein
MYVEKIVEVATNEELFAQSNHPYTEALLSAVPRPNPAIRNVGRRIRLESEVADPANPPRGCYFHLRCLYAKEKCITIEPELRDMGHGHRVACHFADDLNLMGVYSENTGNNRT